MDWKPAPLRRKRAGLESATACLIQHLYLAPEVPFGGSKWSGIGHENGPWGLAAFSEQHMVNVAKK